MVSVYVTLDIPGYGILGPTPVFESSGIEFQFSRGRGKANVRFVLDLDANRRAVRTDHVRLLVDRSSRKVFCCYRLLVAAINAFLDQKRSVLAHVVERRQSLVLRCLGKARHAVL